MNYGAMEKIPCSTVHCTAAGHRTDFRVILLGCCISWVFAVPIDNDGWTEALSEAVRQ